MSAKDLRLVHRAAEVAHKAEEEVKTDADLFQDGTNAPQSVNPFSGLAATFQHEQQVEAQVEEKGEAFLDQQLPPKVAAARSARSKRDLLASCATPAGMDATAREIAATVIERLQAVPSEGRNEVWRLVVQHLAAGGFLVNELELVSAAA